MELDAVVESIVEGCARNGSVVSSALATFMARVIVENDPVNFAPDREVKDAELQMLIERATIRLCERDSPPIETIKMQAEFDSTYVLMEEALESERREKGSQTKLLIDNVLRAAAKANNYETMNAVYREIYSFLAKMSPANKEEEEIAAAMESVFPRIGLKSFVQLTAEEKRGQLQELVRLVTGIRLFNREMGKGGARLDRVESLASNKVNDLRDILQAETAEQHALAMRYQETLVYCHLRSPEGVSTQQTTRWAQELANRRQYCAYLSSLAEDLAASGQRIDAQRQSFSNQIKQLKGLVQGRASVPKDQVYPKFDAIAAAWFDLDAQLKIVKARTEALETLHRFRESYQPTLPASHPVYLAARLDQQHQQQSADASIPSRGGQGEVNVDSKFAPAGPTVAPLIKKSSSVIEQEADMAQAAVLATSSAASGPAPSLPSTESIARERARTPLYSNAEEDDEDRPVRLSVETTPEFMQLPLEYQGFCGWTVANRHGLLLPGNPKLGVVRHRGACYVFAHAVALNAFLERPEVLKSAVLETASSNPELIHLLRLQGQYPGTSIAKVIGDEAKQRARLDPRRQRKDDEDKDALFTGTKKKVDAATETPTHFVEKKIDIDYEWNEWSIRRRALRVAQLQNTCQTHSMQTDASHFRRDNTTQVYLPRINSTQTKRDSSCNPPIKVQYLAGLRGKHRHTKYSKDFREKKPGVVTLTYE